jgi:signal transduction histidine kinase
MTDQSSEQMLAWLRRGLTFHPVHDLRFDPESGRLDFRVDDHPDAPDQTLIVLPDDRRGLGDAAEQDHALIDFRAWQGQSLGHFRLVADGSRHGLGSGLIMRLDTVQRRAAATVPGRGAADPRMVNAMAAHELKQPLFTIAMAAKNIELMLGHHRSGVAVDDLGGIAQAAARIGLQVQRAQAIIASIIGEAGGAPQHPQTSDVRQAMIRAHEFLKPLLDQHGVVTRLALPGEILQVALPQVAVEQVIVNAMQNAMDSLLAARLHGRPAGLLTLTAGRRQASVLCQVRDDGEGLTQGTHRNVFTPFFTTKSAGGSLGLGLHISRQIVVNAGGTIDLLSNPDHGATLVFSLPMFDDA